jgi:hypothetical protein
MGFRWIFAWAAGGLLYWLQVDINMGFWWTFVLASGRY